MKSLMNRVVVCSVCVAGLLTKGLNVEAATWSGGGTESVWSDAGNWDTTPAEGEALIFGGTAKQVNTNDLLASVGAVTFSTAGWSVRGNAVTLGGNMTLSAGGTAEWALDTTLSATRCARGR